MRSNFKVVVLGKMDNSVDHTFDSANRIYGRGGVSPTIHTCTSGGSWPKIVAMRKRGEGVQTIITSGNVKIWRKDMKSDEFAIRRITPREAWRLMGYLDSDFDKASAVTSKSQLYKQAGNAIVKQVLMAIFLQLGIQGKKRWNELSVEERERLVKKSSFC